MQMDFLANRNDLLNIVGYFLDQLHCNVTEAYSLVNQPNRRFMSIDDIKNAKLQHNSINFKIWSPAFTNNPIFRSYQLNEDIGGGTRTVVEGPAMIQLTSGRVENGCLFPSTVSHWNEAGARQRSPYSEEELDEADWATLRSVSRRICRQIKNKMSVGHLKNMPILPGAYDDFVFGRYFFWNWGEMIKPGSSKIFFKNLT